MNRYYIELKRFEGIELVFYRVFDSHEQRCWMQMIGSFSTLAEAEAFISNL